MRVHTHRMVATQLELVLEGRFGSTNQAGHICLQLLGAAQTVQVTATAAVTHSHC